MVVINSTIDNSCSIITVFTICIMVSTKHAKRAIGLHHYIKCEEKCKFN